MPRRERMPDERRRPFKLEYLKYSLLRSSSFPSFLRCETVVSVTSRSWRLMICNRRTFFTAASGFALGTRMAAATAQGANNRIRIGVIGTGGRARGLMNQLKRLPGN